MLTATRMAPSRAEREVDVPGRMSERRRSRASGQFEEPGSEQWSVLPDLERRGAEVDAADDAEPVGAEPFSPMSATAFAPEMSLPDPVFGEEFPLSAAIPTIPAEAAAGFDEALSTSQLSVADDDGAPATSAAGCASLRPWQSGNPMHVPLWPTASVRTVLDAYREVAQTAAGRAIIAAE